MTAFRNGTLIVLAVSCAPVFAMGLGSIQVQSALNQSLRASISTFGVDTANVGELCAKGRVETLDGVLLAQPLIALGGGAQSTRLVLTTTQSINEPAVAINVQIGCGTSIRRSYQILLDPASTALPTVKGATTSHAEEFSARSAPVGKSGVTLASSDAVTLRATPPSEKLKEQAAHESSRAPSDTRKNSAGQNATHSIARLARESSRRINRHTRSKSKRLSRSVLRLSDDLGPIDSTSILGGMKLSENLNVGNIETDAQRLAELRSAQLRFAAIQRGEDPEKNAEAETKAALATIQSLQAEAQKAREQRDAARRAFAERQRRSVDVNWFIGLAVLLLLSMIALGWLAWRLAAINRMREYSFWNEDQSDDGDESDIDDRHDDTLFSDTVAEFEESASMQDDMPSVHVERDQPRSDDGVGKLPGRIQRTSHEHNAVEPAAETAPERSSAAILPLQKPSMLTRTQKRSEMIKVEEISDAMEEAEFWMSLRDPQRAISVLEQYYADHPNWPMASLYLLQLYREVDDRTNYDALLERFKRNFNGKAPEWDTDVSTVSNKGLEDYPHLLKQICSLWGSNQAGPFLANLLFNNRTGQREGFDLPVYLDLVLLANIAYELQGESGSDKPANATRL
jgi:hypothetical protein